MKISSMARLMAAAAFAATAGAASAQTDAGRCAATGSPDPAIQDCTRAIDSGKVAGEALARLHYSRGAQWAAKGVYDRAIADYDVAVRLNPRFAQAYYQRGNAWSNKGDSAKAIADFDAAIRLNPKDTAGLAGRAVEFTVTGDYARAIADYDSAIALDGASSTLFLGRGRVRLYSGDYARSVADLERSLAITPNTYTSLWLYLARKRSGSLNAEESLDSETRGQRGGWPSPVAVLYLGRTDVSSVLASATDKDPRRQSEQFCEANFYLAQWRLLHGDAGAAIPLLKEAQAGCSGEFIEHEGAVAELRRLQR